MEDDNIRFYERNYLNEINKNDETFTGDADGCGATLVPVFCNKIQEEIYEIH